MSNASASQYRWHIQRLKKALSNVPDTGAHVVGAENDTARSKGRACRELAEIRAELGEMLEGAE